MNPCFFEDRTARQRIAAEMIVARIERNLALRRLQDRAIKMEMRRMYRVRMFVNGALFIIAAVSIFALIWWYGI